MEGRPGNQAAEDTGALPIELRRERRRDSNPQPPCPEQKEPPSAQQADSTVKEQRQRHRHVNKTSGSTPRSAPLHSLALRPTPPLRSAPASRAARSLRCRLPVAASPGLEPGPPGSEPGVVPVPPTRTAVNRNGLDGEIRTPNLRLPTPARFQVALRPVGTHGEHRTRTSRGLSAVPLPVGLREHEKRRRGPVTR